jgi:uroporphyrinogen III methyltransferase/synthase
MKRILITRPRLQAEAFAAELRAAGFEPVFLPVIEIRPLEDNTELLRAAAHLSGYDWIVFTSVNAVAVFFDALPPALQSGGWGVKVAAIGPKTAWALKEHGVVPSFTPQEYVAEAILPGLGDLRGRRVLLPRAAGARQALPAAITAAGGVAHEIAIYHTVPAELDPAGLAALTAGVDVVTFTSPSTVENFVQMVRRQGLDPFNLPGAPHIACIGPVTQSAALQAGFPAAIVAGEYTIQGLTEVLRSLR